eukprot:scpid92304/ scgid8359/ 
MSMSARNMMLSTVATRLTHEASSQVGVAALFHVDSSIHPNGSTHPKQNTKKHAPRERSHSRLKQSTVLSNNAMLPGHSRKVTELLCILGILMLLDTRSFTNRFTAYNALLELFW